MSMGKGLDSYAGELGKTALGNLLDLIVDARLGYDVVRRAGYPELAEVTKLSEGPWGGFIFDGDLPDVYVPAQLGPVKERSLFSVKLDPGYYPHVTNWMRLREKGSKNLSRVLYPMPGDVTSVRRVGKKFLIGRRKSPSDSPISFEMKKEDFQALSKRKIELMKDPVWRREARDASLDIVGIGREYLSDSEMEDRLLTGLYVSTGNELDESQKMLEEVRELAFVYEERMKHQEEMAAR
jgi:hypothetical protein